MTPTQRAAARVLDAWDSTVLPVANDGRLQEAMEDLRAALAEQAAEQALACGHHASLAVVSAESGETLYCELCDDKAGRRDAELREQELQAELAALRTAPPAPARQEWQCLGYMSPKQVERIVDAEDAWGTYIPMRKTPAGLFTLALYAAPITAAPAEGGAA